MFARPADRDVIEQVAAAAGVPFVGIWLDAPHDVLVERAALRQGDASDADAAVIQRQMEADTGRIRWHRIDAAPALDQVIGQATAVIDAQLGQRPAQPLS